MKKTAIIVIVLLIILIVAGRALYRGGGREEVPSVSKNPTGQPTATQLGFDPSDNLDQALQELDAAK